MSKIKFEESNKVGFFRQKGFYAAVLVCLLAMGAGTWTAFNKVNPNSGEADNSFSLTSIDFNSDIQGAGKNVTGVPKNTTATNSKKASSEKTTAQTALNKVADFFVLPVGNEIIKRYSDNELQFSETYNDWRLHLGIDIKATKGTEVKTAGDGVVKDITEDPLWGTTIVINHGKGIIASYSGLNKVPNVKLNQVVETGTVIGTIDTIPCESVEQPHLHFSVKKDNKYVSPVDTLKLND